jgi:leader peptidase (prepilin peptidase)/N-methyltransferase
MMVVGAAAGAATPMIAARFGVNPKTWPWVAVGALAGASLGQTLIPTEAVVWSVILAVGLPLAAIDLGARRLPDALVLPAAAAAVVATVVGGASAAVAGGIALVTLYALLAVLPRSGLGFGDVKLAGLLGTALALLGSASPPNWSALAWGTALAFGSGGLVAVVLLATGRARRETALPFGPHMLAGALLAAALFGSAGHGGEQAVDVPGRLLVREVHQGRALVAGAWAEHGKRQPRNATAGGQPPGSQGASWNGGEWEVGYLGLAM